MTTIELSDEQASALQAQAEARGTTLEDWLTILAKDGKAVLDWSQCAAVESVPGKVGGAWVFRDTRMQVTVVFENLEDGMTIDELINAYDGLTRDQVQAALEFAAQSLRTRPVAH